MRVIHVLRKPLSEGTVASNVLKHGCGGLNIDASRVGTDDNLNGGAYAKNASARHDGAENWRYKRGEQGNAGEYRPPPGRWPANVILQHLDGCRCEGTRRVKAAGWRDTDAHKGDQGVTQNFGASDITGRHYADADGTETVANWICAPGCPVQEMDEQSGVLAPQGGQKHKDTKEGSFLDTGFGGSPTSSFYGDKGGASRFFKQVGGQTE